MHIEIDTREQVMTVDGLRMSFEVLRVLADPDRTRFYRFRRDDETMTIEGYSFEQMTVKGGET